MVLDTEKRRTAGFDKISKQALSRSIEILIFLRILDFSLFSGLKIVFFSISHFNCTTTYRAPNCETNEPLPESREITLNRDPESGFGFVAGSERPVIVRFVEEGICHTISQIVDCFGFNKKNFNFVSVLLKVDLVKINCKLVIRF